jgi:hypothetical protein
MEPISQLEFNVLPVAKIKIEDGNEYQLVLDYNAIAKAEPLLSIAPEIKDEKGKVLSPAHKRDLSVRFDWAGLTGPDLSVICWAAFDRFHPEITLRQVRQMLAPAQNSQLFEMLFESAYPGVLAKLVEAASELAKGEPISPNVDAVAS